jgi:hypothetical protein
MQPSSSSERTRPTEKSVDTRDTGYADIKGGEADKPGQSPHDEKRSPSKAGEDK